MRAGTQHLNWQRKIAAARSFVIHRHMDIENDGFRTVPGVISSLQCQELLEDLGSGSEAGRRGLLALDAIAEFARSHRMMDIIRPYLHGSPLPVRAILFDKSPDANWLVPWHQDLTIAVREPKDTRGFGPWSMKDDIPHVQPPVALLEQMITVRLHLDDADGSNGALRVIPGSHRNGRLSHESIREIRNVTPEVLCCAKKGDALLMRPLILHASAKSTNRAHRRVLHIEYAGFVLPGGLDWHPAA